MQSLGLGKTLFNSSVCIFENNCPEIFLTERLTRKKASGAWPSIALKSLVERPLLEDLLIAENRDVEDPKLIEETLNSQFPFFAHLKAHKLEPYSRIFNPNIKFITHHRAHAAAAAYMSPFEKCLILVIDGAGSRIKFFDEANPEFIILNQMAASLESAEERTLYSFEHGQLICLDKKVQTFQKSISHPDHFFSEGLGSFYEKISEFIFNSKRSAGKVMGLAALGSPASESSDYISYLEKMNWKNQFSEQTKMSWEVSPHLAEYKNVAADAQKFFEADYISYILELKKRYTDFDNLIITGGCALNCTSNMKIFNSRVFSNVYVPPFPGDESISLGCAYSNFLEQEPFSWKINSFVQQHGYFGPVSSIATEQKIRSVFEDYEITKHESIVDYAAQQLMEGKIIAWFQGRSESGPRALGNRSILCRPDKKGVKDLLNSKIKFRESFRPYGCSVAFEKSHQYFKVPKGFDNPYMSFAVEVTTEFKELLAEVTHVDGTSRMQTVRPGQNPLFFELLMEFGKKTNLYCLLNTSLNIMGEPIVETVEDAENFLATVPVDGLAINNFYIRKK